MENATAHLLADATKDSGDVALRAVHLAADQAFYGAHLLPFLARYRTTDHFRVVDIGCGIGMISRRVAAHFPNAEVVAVEPDADDIRAAQDGAPPNIRFVHAKAEDFEETGFDVVVCSEVFEHVPDPVGLLAVCAGACRPGGTLSFSTPSGWMMRQPRLVNVALAVSRPREFRARLFPERHWLEALPKHPGSRSRILRRLLDDAGFDLTSRTSSCVRFEPDWPSAATAFSGGRRNSWLLLVAHLLGRGDDLRTAQAAWQLHGLAEASMNLLRLRIPESRVLMAATRR